MSYVFTIIGIKKDAIELQPTQKMATQIGVFAETVDEAIKKAEKLIPLESYNIARIDEIKEKDESN